MIDFTKPVKVYFNLRKKVFSVQQGGRVVAHVSSIDLYDVKFQVREAGRQRLLATKQKNVHAFVVGRALVPGGPALDLNFDFRVTYNPYKAATFTIAETGEPIYAATYAALRNKGKPSIMVRA